MQVSYTQKTSESLELAQQHFAQAIKLNPNNMRALYGHHLVRTPDHIKNKCVLWCFNRRAVLRTSQELGRIILGTMIGRGH